jgi:hypothetical protein
MKDIELIMMRFTSIFLMNRSDESQVESPSQTVMKIMAAIQVRFTAMRMIF